MSGGDPSPRVAFDHAALDATERLFWGDIWDATPAEVAAGHLAAAVEWLDALGGRYYVPLYPGDPGAPEAEAWLRGNGFGKGYGWMKFVRDASPPELPEWGAALFSELPGREGWCCYVAEVDGAPQGAAAMRINEGVAEFGAAATLEAARGRGCQTELLHRRIDDAADAGCHLLFVETGERVPGKPDASYRNILRAGFEEAYIRPNWRRE